MNCRTTRERSLPGLPAGSPTSWTWAGSSMKTRCRSCRGTTRMSGSSLWRTENLPKASDRTKIIGRTGRIERSMRPMMTGKAPLFPVLSKLNVGGLDRLPARNGWQRGANRKTEATTLTHPTRLGRRVGPHSPIFRGPLSARPERAIGTWPKRRKHRRTSRPEWRGRRFRPSRLAVRRLTGEIS